MPLPDLERLDTNTTPTNCADVLLFGIVKDENLRLPFFFDHYRRAGVRHFYVVDNGSTDGTTEFLLQQRDCSVFYTNGSYAASRAGLKWLNPLMDEFGSGH